MKTNQEYKNLALSKLKGNWKPAVITSLVYVLVCAVFSAIVNLVSDSDLLVVILTIVQMLILLPLVVGYSNAFRYMLVKGDYNLLHNMVDIAKADVKRNALGMLLMAVKTMLWSLLLLIPGLIKSYAYRLTPYILNDKPEIGFKEASSLSDEMMKGHKFDLFWLDLSFIGWMLLGILTLGIGYLWLQPYMLTASAAFYEDVKLEYENKKQTI